MAALTLLTSNATFTVLEALCSAFEKAGGSAVTIQADSATVMLGRIRDGERAELAVLNAPHLDELVASHVIDAGTRRLFARSHIQKTLESTAGLFAPPAGRSAAAALLRFFGEPSNAALFRERGLEQP